MSRKKLGVILLASVCIVVIAAYVLNGNTMVESGETEPPSNSPENPESPPFAIPENPLGALGLMSALAAALGIFAIGKKRP